MYFVYSPDLLEEYCYTFIVYTIYYDSCTRNTSPSGAKGGQLVLYGLTLLKSTFSALIDNAPNHASGIPLEIGLSDLCLNGK